MGINAASIALEQRSGRKLIAYCHAAFSRFVALGALVTGLLLVAGVPLKLLYVVAALVYVGFIAAMLTTRALPHEADTEGHAAPAGGYRRAGVHLGECFRGFPNATRQGHEAHLRGHVSWPFGEPPGTRHRRVTRSHLKNSR